MAPGAAVDLRDRDRAKATQVGTGVVASEILSSLLKASSRLGTLGTGLGQGFARPADTASSLMHSQQQLKTLVAGQRPTGSGFLAVGSSGATQAGKPAFDAQLLTALASYSAVADA